MRLMVYVLEKYFVHITCAIVVFITLAITGSEQGGITPLSITVDFINVFSLMVILIAVFEGLSRLRWNIWVTHILTIPIANFFAVLLDFNLVLFVFTEGEMVSTTFPEGSEISAGLFVEEYVSDLLYPALFWTLAAGISHIWHNRLQQKVSRATAETSINVTGFLKELPTDWHHRIDVLEAQENYIRVSVGDESRTVLYRFKDAISDLGDSVGLQAHRSFWVRKQAIKAFRKSQGKGEITTTTGQIIPVSRTYLKTVEKVIDIHS